MRIDDLDSPRTRPGADRAALDDLSWLGLDWDGPVTYQTQLLERYTAGLRALAAAGWIYPCRCTRTQIAARIASAPNEGDHELRYNGFCRPASRESQIWDSTVHPGAAWRVRVGEEPLSFVDEIAGHQSVAIAAEVGDFLVANKQGAPSYQLAVNFDDQFQDVTDVIRGDDLLTSAARQIYLRKLLELPAPIRYWHLPLVVGPDGLRLAKRHEDTRLARYREWGVSPERVIGLIAYWSGNPELRPMDRAEFLSWFDVARLPRERVVF
jgi:glutamyl-tRNA synthetase